MVPISMAKIQMGEQGVMKPVFDKNDSVFYAFPDDSRGEGKNKIESFDPTIRAADHDLGINKALDLLSFKCGMGTGRYKFENGVVKTATEVISDKSDLYQSLKKHEIVLVKSLVKGQLDFFLVQSPKEITIEFDDSIIEDKVSERQQDRQDVGMGVMPLWEYRKKWYGETEDEAKAMIPEVADTID